MTSTKAPECMHCALSAVRLVGGLTIYPHRADLADLNFWRCDQCGGYVGCHRGTDRPLGRPAARALRALRQRVHSDYLDPIWKNAPRFGRDGRASRTVVYKYLRVMMGLSKEECHVALFDNRQCLDAIEILKPVNIISIYRNLERMKEEGEIE